MLREGFPKEVIFERGSKLCQGESPSKSKGREFQAEGRPKVKSFNAGLNLAKMKRKPVWQKHSE